MISTRCPSHEMAGDKEAMRVSRQLACNDLLDAENIFPEVL